MVAILAICMSVLSMAINAFTICVLIRTGRALLLAAGALLLIGVGLCSLAAAVRYHADTPRQDW